jgi:hypothetical protein
MSVIMFPGEQDEQLGRPVRLLRARVPVRGWFAAPNLGTGSFVGSVRVMRVARRAGPWCHGVVAGTLYDASGRRVGSASQRCQLPIEVRWDGGGRWLSIGPLEADLLGLRVSVEQVVLWSDASGTKAAGEQPGGAASGPVGDAGGADRRVVPLRRRA